ncbi:putative enzyme related to lactoylglutathione lyase [Nocardioides zeae]|uniref:Enzyme related to lactoylglutathione lyase n=1 Tax=Nocardioides zeae TaxID=1457234 RepID=A0ACC6IF80_9ACTN|nr:VOC family protein [Nocardioides zeae]MDR6174362.1 putative enzyme related to lactoylglutathione lyase [Nocardioides zeae]MDR6209167.1 putative enzyme related to lactoylglutathione lyase [Nocardioides zeae]
MPLHHTIDYVELSVGDLGASTSFYADAFGWRTTSYGPGYTGFHDDPGSDHEGGGLALGDERPGRPLVLLYSADLDATLAAVEAAGGTVTQGPYSFPGGRRFHFTDPTGNELGVWSER